MNKRGEPVYPAAEDAFSVLAEQAPTLLWRLAWYWHEVVVLRRLAWFTQFSHHNSDPPSVVQDTVTTCAILCPWPQSVHTEITFLVLSVIYAIGDSHPAAEQAELGKGESRPYGGSESKPCWPLVNIRIAVKRFFISSSRFIYGVIYFKTV